MATHAVGGVQLATGEAVLQDAVRVAGVMGSEGGTECFGAHWAVVEGRSLCAAGAYCTSGAPLIAHDNGVGEPVIAESSEAFTPELAGRVEDTGREKSPITC